MRLTREEGRQIVWGDHADWKQVTGEEVTSTTRWTNWMKAVFLHIPTGKHYAIAWQRGATEYQEMKPFEDCDPKPVEVEEREVVRKEWMPVETVQSVASAIHPPDDSF